MVTRPNTRRLLPGVVALLLALTSCGRQEQPPPAPAATPAPPTTVPPITVATPPPPSPSPTPPPVWGEARWGMTRKEVLAAFPGKAQRLSRPAPFSQPQPGSSLTPGSSDVAISAHETEGTTFRVLFGFAGDALDRIHLAAAKPGEATCSDLERALTAAHAAPAGRTRTGDSLRGEEVTWRKPEQTIVLSCAGLFSLGFQKVTLDYLVPAADAPTEGEAAAPR
jgi:hypothetical protein